MKNTLRPVTSIAMLQHLATSHPDFFVNEYRELAFAAARNLGGSPTTLVDAIRWLNINANETSEEGVVDEINFLIDMDN